MKYHSRLKLISHACAMLVAVVCGLSGVAASAADEHPAHFPKIPEATEYSYKQTPQGELKLWAIGPDHHGDADSSAHPAIVFFFGGGWRSGSPQQFVPHARYLAKRGMVAVLVDYRVSSRHQTRAVDSVADAKSAIRWVRQNAEMLHVDPQRVCAAGGSAGGHLAACCALIEGFDEQSEQQRISSVPDAMALFNPAVMLAPLDDTQLAGVDAERLASLQERMGVEPKELSPVHHVQSQMPPTMIVHGESDTTVPFSTVQEFTARMQAAGNRCELHGYPGAPHGFFNFREQGFELGQDNARSDNSRMWFGQTLLRLDEFLTSLSWLDGPADLTASHNRHLRVRSGLANSLHKFQTEQKGHVAFLGGSITEMNGYRPRVESWLQDRFPETEFQFTNAGIASTCSTTGAFRLNRDVLQHGPVDLLIVEFAVNDNQDAAHSADNCIRGMEGIIRQVRRHNPRSDIVMVHFVNPEMLSQVQDGREPRSSGQHERVARFYQIPSVHVCRALADRIADEEMTWKDYGGTHPRDQGNQLAADLVGELMAAAWRPGLADLQPDAYETPEAMLLETSYVQAEMLDRSRIQADAHWTYGVPDWESLPGSKRARFLKEQLWYSDAPAAQLEFRFTGTAAGAYVLAGPDAGQVDVSIDGGEWKTVDLFHRFSRGLHYPRTVMFAVDLKPQQHEVRVRVSEGRNPESQGTAVRVLAFVANETAAEVPVGSISSRR